ncbi:MAG TPA: DciA family protein [Rhizomicrobium sp.]
MPQRRDEKQPELPFVRRNRSEPVSRGASELSAAALTRMGFRDPTLVLRWEEIAGPAVARIARPLKFSEGQSGGTLTLRAEPGASLFLQHETRQLCERINAYLGRAAVTKLRFVQAPLPPKLIHRPPPKRAAHVPAGDPALSYKGPESLREALVNLARARAPRTPSRGN